MRKLAAALLLLPSSALLAQSDADSVIVAFRYYSSPSTVVHVRGEFVGWGDADLGEATVMSFDSALGCWVKEFTFKTKDPADSRRLLGDSVWQYKFFPVGTIGDWPSDPLNPEQNSNDYNNSVLRLTSLRWFEPYTRDSSGFITALAASLIHAKTDSIVSIRFESAPTVDDSPSVYDMTDSLDRSRRIVSFRIPVPVPPTHSFRLVARNVGGDSVVYRRITYKIIKESYPPNARRGVTLPDSSQGRYATTFRLQIPDTNIILLRVAPLGQSPLGVEPIPMKLNTSSLDWWASVSLNPGTYEYLYELSNGKSIYDPWGRVNGTYGTRFVVGPVGLSADDYAWNANSYQRPSADRIVLYEMNLREFTAKGPAGGTFRDLIPMLGHFNDLGVNAIELMPINDYGNVGLSNYFSWGYDPNHHFALEPSYGTPAELKELVDSAHSRGIAVIIDLVFNHLNDPAPLWQMVPDESMNPYFKLPPPLQTRSNEDGLVFFKDMDLWTPEAQQYVYDVVKMWLDEYHVDGFRYDYTQGIGWAMNDTIGGIPGWTRRIHWEYGGKIIQIAEHLPENPALILYGKLTGGWHDSFRDEIFDDARFQNTGLAEFENLVLGLGAYGGNDSPQGTSYSDRTQPVNHTNNHDEQTLIYEMINFQGVDSIDAYARDKMYGAMMFTSLGIPMLWQGMEWGEPRGWDGADGGVRMGYRPLRWNLKSTERGRDHFRWYKTLAYQRRMNPALYNGEFVKLYRDSTRILVWGFSDSTTGSQVVIAANLSGTNQWITNVPWLSTGTWYEIVSQSPYLVSSNPIPVLGIPRYTALIYSNKTNDQLNIPVSVEEPPEQRIPASFFLSANYPNPFNPGTSIQYHLPVAANVRIEVYNVTGELVAVLVNGRIPAGEHVAYWNGSTSSGVPASTGMYLIRFQNDERTETRKILLLR